MLSESVAVKLAKREGAAQGTLILPDIPVGEWAWSLGEVGPRWVLGTEKPLYYHMTRSIQSGWYFVLSVTCPV